MFSKFSILINKHFFFLIAYLVSISHPSTLSSNEQHMVFSFSSRRILRVKIKLVVESKKKKNWKEATPLSGLVQVIKTSFSSDTIGELMSSASSATRRQPGTAAQLHVSASPPSLGSSSSCGSPTYCSRFHTDTKPNLCPLGSDASHN